MRHGLCFMHNTPDVVHNFILFPKKKRLLFKTSRGQPGARIDGSTILQKCVDELKIASNTTKRHINSPHYSIP